jgi:hypothetical protein
MAPSTPAPLSKPSSERYLSFAEREEAALSYHRKGRFSSRSIIQTRIFPLPRDRNIPAGRLAIESA